VPPEQIVLISFHADTITECKRLIPEIKAHWLTGYEKREDGHFAPTADEVLANLRDCHADGLGSQAAPEHFDQSFLKKLRAGGFREFHVWTVNDAETAGHYQRLGAWSITTDRPAWLRAQIEAVASDSGR
jgi:glycerophosphoryl diester phosphodiesterase